MNTINSKRKIRVKVPDPGVSHKTIRLVNEVNKLVSPGVDFEYHSSSSTREKQMKYLKNTGAPIAKYKRLRVTVPHIGVSHKSERLNAALGYLIQKLGKRR